MSEPRIAHLVYDLIRGGTEGQCARVAMGLARQGLPHRVAVFHRRGFFLEAVAAVCGPVHEVVIRHLARPATVREVIRLAQWLRRERIDLLHAWDADAAIFGQFAAQWAGIRLVTSHRDLGQIYPPHKLALMRRADHRAIRVVANAEAVRTHFIARGVPAVKIDVLPNLLDLEEFDRLAARPSACAERLPAGRRLVVVNRLDPEKNTGVLIAALPQVRQVIPDAILIVAGAGQELAQLQRQAAGLGLAGAVCFLGETHEIPALLRQCEAGALVSANNEGLSNTILEYMAARLPVLATDCGGNRELVVDGQTGRLVSLPAQPSQVAQSWIDLFRQPAWSRELGEAGRRRIECNHAVPAVLRQFQAMYACCCNGRRK